MVHNSGVPDGVSKIRTPRTTVMCRVFSDGSLAPRPKLYSDTIFSFFIHVCKILEVDKISIRIQSASLIFWSLVLGLIEYGNDHFMLERTKFNKLKLHCKEQEYSTLNNNAFSLYLNNMRLTWKTTLFLVFIGLWTFFKNACRLIIFISEVHILILIE